MLEVCLAVAFTACSGGDTRDDDSCSVNRPCVAGFVCSPIDHKCHETFAQSDARISDAPAPDESVDAPLAADAAPDGAIAPADAPIDTPDAGAIDATSPPDAPELPPDALAPADAPLPDASQPDAPPPPDAAPPPPDAPPPPPDASPPDASPPIVITVLDTNGLPVSGVPVVFHDPQGNPLDVQTTSSTGVARGVLASGGAVTALQEPFADESLRTTVFAVKPGDVLTIGAPPARTEGPDRTPVTVKLPGVVDGTDKYTLDTACTYMENQDGSDFLVEVINDCAQGGTYDFLAAARTPYPWRPLAYAWVKDASPTGTITLSSWDSTTTSFSLTGPPHWESAFLDLIPLRRNIQHGGDNVQVLSDAPIELKLPAGFADATIVSLSTYAVNSSSYYRSRIAAAPGASISVASSALMPAVQNAMIDTAPAGFARPRVTWSMTATPPAIDGGTVMFGWSDIQFKVARPEAPPTPHRWLLVFPSSMVGAVTPPILPESLSGWRPDAGSAPNLYLNNISLFEGSWIAGYDAYRKAYANLTEPSTGSWVSRGVRGR